MAFDPELISILNGITTPTFCVLVCFFLYTYFTKKEKSQAEAWAEERKEFLKRLQQKDDELKELRDIHSKEIISLRSENNRILTAYHEQSGQVMKILDDTNRYITLSQDKTQSQGSDIKTLLDKIHEKINWLVNRYTHGGNPDIP